MVESNEKIGFGKRLVAHIADMIVLYIVMMAVMAIMIAIGMFDMSAVHNKAEYAAKLKTWTVSLTLLAQLAYFSLMESSSKQGTFGKMMMGIKVINAEGNKLSLLNAVGRYFGKILSGIIFGIGFIMIIFSKDKQGLHDKLAKTYVIKK